MAQNEPPSGGPALPCVPNGSYGMTYRSWLVGRIVPHLEGTLDRRAYKAVEIANHTIRFMLMDQDEFEKAERFLK